MKKYELLKHLNDQEIFNLAIKFLQNEKNFKGGSVNKAMNVYHKSIGKAPMTKATFYRHYDANERGGRRANTCQEDWQDIIDGSNWWYANRGKIKEVKNIPRNVAFNIEDLEEYFLLTNHKAKGASVVDLGYLEARINDQDKIISKQDRLIEKQDTIILMMSKRIDDLVLLMK